MDYYVVEYERFEDGDSKEREIYYIGTNDDEAIQFAKHFIHNSGKEWIYENQYDFDRFIFMATLGSAFITVEKFTF